MKVIRYPLPADVQRQITANLQRGRELADPPVAPIRFPLSIRWYLLTTYRSWTTWQQVWRNVIYLITGVKIDDRRRRIE